MRKRKKNFLRRTRPASTTLIPLIFTAAVKQQSERFLNGTISVSQLSQAMKLGELGEQVVIRSKKAFERVVYIDSVEADNLIWYPKRKARDDKARHDYLTTDRMNYIKGDIYITRIIDEEMKNTDERLR